MLMENFGKYFVAALSLGAALSCSKTLIEIPDQSQDFSHIESVAPLMGSKLAGRSSGEFCKGELLLMLDSEMTALWEKGDSAALVRSLCGDFSFTHFGPALKVKPKNEVLARELGLDRWFVLNFDPALPLTQVGEKLAACEAVELVQMNAVCEHEPCPYVVEDENFAYTKAMQPYAMDDPMYPLQWNLYNDGSMSKLAVAGADVSAAYAWNICAGDPRVVVAIIDGPVQYDHEDLADNIWVNEAELKGQAGVDDDGNGYVDDIYGYNFVLDTGEINWKASKEDGHGTHVAGIIAASNGNGKGVCSIAGGYPGEKGVRLMGIQVFYGNSSATDRSHGDAFIYAADNGAAVAQCSFGYNTIMKNETEYSLKAPFEYRGIRYFLDPSNANCEAVGGNIAVFAAGNSGLGSAMYPAAMSDCVAVTAVGPDGLPTFYTNYGKGCNIAAPGGELYYDNNSKILSTGITSVTGSYIRLQGTSQACPHVSGVAALGMSYALQSGKSYTREEFLSMLMGSVNDIDSRLLSTDSKTDRMGNKVVLKTYYKKMGTGIVDAWRMLMQIDGIPSALVECGADCTIRLDEYFGSGAGTLTYLGVEAEDKYKEALGIEDMKLENGALKIRCSKNGCGKIRIRAIAGGSNVGTADAPGGMEISRELSVISRGVVGWNNAWL